MTLVLMTTPIKANVSHNKADSFHFKNVSASNECDANLHPRRSSNKALAESCLLSVVLHLSTRGQSDKNTWLLWLLTNLRWNSLANCLFLSSAPSCFIKPYRLNVQALAVVLSLLCVYPLPLKCFFLFGGLRFSFPWQNILEYFFPPSQFRNGLQWSQMCSEGVEIQMWCPSTDLCIGHISNVCNCRIMKPKICILLTQCSRNVMSSSQGRFNYFSECQLVFATLFGSEIKLERTWNVPILLVSSLTVTVDHLVKLHDVVKEQRRFPQRFWKWRSGKHANAKKNKQKKPSIYYKFYSSRLTLSWILCSR